MNFKLQPLIVCFTLACLLSSACSTKEDPNVTNQDFQFTNLKGVDSAKFLYENPKVVVLDIRTPAEFNQGHIPNALNIDYKADNFEMELGKLDRNTTYLMHCRSGRRSSNSFDTFKKLGFKNIVHIDDGILGWKEELVQ